MTFENSVNLNWKATYSDGSTKTEQDNAYSQLNREGLTSFGLFTTDDKPVFILKLTTTKKLFYRMRVAYKPQAGSERIYLLGYHTAKGAFSLTVIDQSGNVLNFNSFKEANLEEIQYFENEKI
jgi:hypothetical protein